MAGFARIPIFAGPRFAYGFIELKASRMEVHVTLSCGRELGAEGAQGI